MGTMGASKSNIRSFRYSDRVAEILEQQPGDSLNAKFEALVLRCYDELPETQQLLDRLNKQIQAARIKLADISKMQESCAQLHRAADNIMWAYKQYAERYVTQAETLQRDQAPQDVLQDDEAVDGRGIFV